jgi:hypothetical protein
MAGQARHPRAQCDAGRPPLDNGVALVDQFDLEDEFENASGDCIGRSFCAKRIALFIPPAGATNQEGGSGMRLRSIGASVASLMLVTVIGAGCAKEEKAEATRAEQAATRAEDAAKRAESAASRVEAAASRAEAAAEKAERATMHGMRK